MENIKKLLPGTIVYVYEHWSQNIIRAIIEGYCENGYSIHYEAVVDKNGEVITSFLGNSSRNYENVWITVKAAFEALEKKNQERIDSYCKQIKTLTDLLNFPLYHCFDGDEYTDYEAIKAYKIRTKELTGIELEED